MIRQGEKGGEAEGEGRRETDLKVYLDLISYAIKIVKVVDPNCMSKLFDAKPVE